MFYLCTIHNCDYRKLIDNKEFSICADLQISLSFILYDIPTKYVRILIETTIQTIYLRNKIWNIFPNMHDKYWIRKVMDICFVR